MARRAAWLAAVAMVALAGCGGDDEDPARERDRALVDALHGGGLVLVLRHTATEKRTDEHESLRSCSEQRNLSKQGRVWARSIGQSMRILDIPVGDVRASPLCRTRDTARLAFGHVTIDRDLVSPGVVGTIDDDDRRTRVLRRMADTPPPRGTNTILVTHTGNIGAAFDLSLDEGELAIFRPRAGPPGASLVGRVTPEGWGRLTDAVKGPGLARLGYGTTIALTLPASSRPARIAASASSSP
jgi:broad specificity phosphatase PhoE